MSSMMNSLSTHDTPRAITVLAGESMEGKQRPWQAEHHYLPMDAYRHGQVPAQTCQHPVNISCPVCPACTTETRLD